MALDSFEKNVKIPDHSIGLTVGGLKSPPFLLPDSNVEQNMDNMSAKHVEAKAEELITDVLSGMGYELVRVKLMSGGSFMTLQIMAERTDDKAMTVEDCVEISHAVSPKLDTDPSMADKYTLEVSSPGVDRPLVRIKDFERFTGHVARIDLETPMDCGQGSKQKRFQGNIVRINGREPNAEVELRTENGAVHVPVNSIARARLVTTEKFSAPKAAAPGIKTKIQGLN